MGLNFYKKRLRQKAEVLNRPRPYPEYLSSLGGDSVLDVGSGPFCLIGREGTIVKLVACDINAHEYYRMMNEQGITPLVPIEKQDMESLAYPDKSFDIVHCVNALDHTANPLKALKEFDRVARKWIYLRHFENEGENNRYKGGHQWNLDRSGRLWNLSESYQLDWWETSVVMSYENKEMIVSLYGFERNNTES
jgi:SAM-dependent methyltransferase